LSEHIAGTRFRRTKPTFWTRGGEVIVPFVHLHLLTFTPAFRVHFGLRVLNDAFPAPELNGPMSEGGWALAGRKYLFNFSTTPDSLLRCADELASFICEVGLPWFQRFEAPDAALATDSPLSDESKARLRLALVGQQDAAAIAASRAMLGLSS
jgi:hypothetical protein